MSKHVFKVGDEVRVKEGVSDVTYGWGGVGHKDVGTIVEVQKSGKLYVKFRMHSNWAANPAEMELVKQAPVKKKVRASGEIVEKVVPKVRAYAVVKDGKVIGLKHLREDARELKAAKGGKANGVIIMELGANKEVR